MQKTFDLVGKLRPDRIAYYSYAHVPWKSPSQRGYSESDLPEDKKKHQLLALGEDILTDLGYVNIGMDHFALETDKLCEAYRNQTLHRNFMGYTVSHTDLLIGLGVSAISDAKTAYAQNDKQVERYQQQVKDQGLAINRGHFLSETDQKIRESILQLICHHQAPWDPTTMNILPQAQEALRTMEQDGMIELLDSDIKITATGKPFIRNICSAFDRYLWQPKGNSDQVFSKAI